MHRFLILVLALGFLVSVVPIASACPLCKESVADNGDVEVPSGADLPAAYNNSIYLMVGMPYLLLGVFGFLVYRGLKQNAEFLASRAAFPGGDDLPRISADPR